ncbi:MAG: DEAD/DEAH box helicase [candidate division Zixibacteria bacterium]|nr:DEAD/DEAH box helicase [candidate division Zixibacteria bacterium]
MIWQFLNKRQLEGIIGEQSFDRFETLVPILLGEDHDPTELFRKENLIKLFNAFAPSDILSDKKFMFTLLNQLPKEKLQDLCKTLGYYDENKTFDESISQLVFLGWQKEEFCRDFLKWAHLPDHFMPVKRADYPTCEFLTPIMKPFKSLMDYQYSVFSSSMIELTKPRSRFVIQMPTGSGKTRTSMEIVTQQIKNIGNNGIILWLAHSQELCEQSLECFKDVWVHVADRPIYLYRCWGRNSTLPYESNHTSFIVASFQGLYSLLRRNRVPFNEIKERVKLIVVDEAHKVIAPTYKEVTKALMGSDTQVIGLTATPGRSSSELEENEELASFFFKRIISITPPEAKSVIEWLREKQILAKISLEPLLTNRTYELTAKERKNLETLYDLPSGFLINLGKDDLRNLEIIKRIDIELKSSSRILFFACSVDHSKFICSVLLYLGYYAAHIDGDTPVHMRKKIIDDFRSGNIRVLCNYGVLSTGFDAPQTDVVFISRPTASLVLYSQMIGRGIRGPAIGGTDKCKIIDVRDNIIGFPDQDLLYEYFEDYWSE